MQSWKLFQRAMRFWVGTSSHKQNSLRWTCSAPIKGVPVKSALSIYVCVCWWQLHRFQDVYPFQCYISDRAEAHKQSHHSPATWTASISSPVMGAEICPVPWSLEVDRENQKPRPFLPHMSYLVHPSFPPQRPFQVEIILYTCWHVIIVQWVYVESHHAPTPVLGTRKQVGNKGYKAQTFVRCSRWVWCSQILRKQ